MTGSAAAGHLSVVTLVTLALSGCGASDSLAGADGGSAPPVVTIEQVGGFVPDDGWIFSDQTIHKIAINLPASSVMAIAADPYTFVEGGVTIDGQLVPRIGVRLRGKIGSFRTLAQKPKFKLEFDELIADQRFYGLKALALNNSVVDCSYLKEPLGYRIYAAAGVPAERTGFARVSVNGADYGLYVVIEVPDDRFLKRHYAEAKGNLYDGKYLWFGGNNYTILDFASSVDDKFGLEEGQGLDVGHQDIKAISTALAASRGNGQLVPALAPLLAWDELHRMMVVDQWTGGNDSYSLNSNSYRVYFNPGDGGRMEMIPYDLDYAFLRDSDWGKSWRRPVGKLAAGCFADAACAAAHKQAVQAVIDAIDPTALLKWFDAVDALTIKDAMNDPRRECSANGVAPLRKQLRDWVNAENGQLRTFWGL